MECKYSPMTNFYPCWFHWYEPYDFTAYLRRWQVYHSPCGVTLRWLGRCP